MNTYYFHYHSLKDALKKESLEELKYIMSEVVSTELIESLENYNKPMTILSSRFDKADEIYEKIAKKFQLNVFSVTETKEKIKVSLAYININNVGIMYNINKVFGEQNENKRY